MREVRALLAVEAAPDAALDDLLIAAEQWFEANNSGCLAHTLEAAALWAVRSGRTDLARALSGALRDHRQRSGIPPLALETMTSARVEEELAPASMPPADGEIGSIGLYGAHQLFIIDAEAARR